MIMIMFFLLLSSPISVFIVHMFVSRLQKRFSPQMSAIVSALVAQVLTALLMYYLVFYNHPMKMIELVAAFLYYFIVYNALAYTYFILFNMSETSRRIRTAYELEKTGYLSESDIIPIYGTSELIDIYLDRIIALNQLICKDGRYVLKSRSLLLYALMLVALSHILGFRRYPNLTKLSKTS